MESEKIQNFVDNPTKDELDAFTKAELRVLAKHYSVVERSSMPKDEIKSNIIKYLVEQQLLPETVISEQNMTNTEPESQSEVQIQAQRIEMELKMKELELKGKQMEMEVRMREMDVRMRELDVAAERRDSSHSFDVAKNVRLVPTFKEDRVGEYFQHFEN